MLHDCGTGTCTLLRGRGQSLRLTWKKHGLLLVALGAIAVQQMPVSAQIIAGGVFDNVNGNMQQNFRKVAYWRGLHQPDTESGWLPVYDGYAFSPSHQVFALAVDPTLRYLISSLRAPCNKALRALDLVREQKRAPVDA